jgi:putative Holliday junction resolvase
MGLDYGSRTLGVALSDPLLITAQGLETIHRESESKLRRTFARLEEIIKEYEVTEIVLGMPYMLDSSTGIQAEKTSAFKKKLEERLKLPVALWDERLTTVAAERAMRETGLKRHKKQKESLDMVAATLILQGYMAWKKSSS